MAEWLPLGLFIGAGALVTLLGNLWAPLLVYRARLRDRRRWAAEHGFSFAPGADAERFVVNRELPGIFHMTRKNRYFDLLRGNDLAVVDYAYIRELGGSAPADTSNARRAATVVMIDVDNDLPPVVVRPWGKRRTARRLVEALPKFSVETDPIVRALFSTIETGDPSFDDVFQVTGPDAEAVRAVLGAEVRQLLLQEPAAEFHFDGQTVLAFDSLLGGEALTRLVEVAGGVRKALHWTSAASATEAR